MPDLSQSTTSDLAWALADALDRASHAAYQKTKAEEEAGALRAELATRLIVGEVVPVDEDVEVALEPPRPQGRRSVSVEGIHRYVETLAPLGLGPEEDPRPRPPKYPTVAELERRAAVLEVYGVPLEELVVTPPLGAPEVVVRSRRAVA